nr:hypothetical protein [Tanacetum cinerariifolium]
MRIEQYLTFTDHALWEVIVNGNSVSLVASAGAEAIKNRFGGNKESKKLKKTILKKNYENFAASSQERLDKNYDSLPSVGNNITLIIRNKSDLDTLSMDDLYNNLNLYESKIKSQSSSSLNSQNVAFVSLDNSSNTNETVNTAHSVSAASSKDQASTATYADDVMFSFFSNQSNALQLDNKDLEQMDTDDLEDIDLKWQATMLTMRVKRFIKKIGKKLDLNSKETVGFDGRKSFQAEEELTNFSLIAYTSQGSSSSASLDSESEVLNNLIDNCKSDGDDNQVNDRFNKDEGYHAVPPPYTGNYMPPKVDLSFAGLDSSVFKSKVSETITSMPKIKTNTSKSSKGSLVKPKTVRPSAPLIEDWESDCEDKNVFKPKEVKKTVKPSLEKIEFVNARNTIIENENKAEKPRKFSQSPRAKIKDFNEKVNTAKVNNVTTTGPKVVVSVVEGNRNNVAKSSA